MATSKKFSELPAASSVGNDDLFAIAHEDALAETGYVSQKLTAAQAGQKVNGDTEYPTSLPSFPENGQNPFAALEKLNADIEALYPVNTASGSIANFTTSLEMPLVECKAEITAQQAGSGTPSPQNERSISGVSSVVFQQTGKNLFDKTQTLEEGNITDDGSIGTATGYVHTDYIKVNAGETYVTSGDVAVGNTRNAIACYNANKEFIIRLLPTVAGGWSFTIPSNTVYIRMNLGGSSRDLDTIQLEKGSTATAYEAYNAETKTIALGQTVYGGNIDAKNGKLTITHVCEELGSLTWDSGTGGVTRFVANPTYTAKAPTAATIQADVISDIFKPVSSKTIYDGTDDYEIAIHTNGAIWVRDTDYSDKDAFKTAMANHYIVYELETPVEITGLTPANFTTFAGEQNIFSDCGDVSVSFKQGIQEYIDAKIAETQALILNS